MNLKMYLDFAFFALASLAFASSLSLTSLILANLSTLGLASCTGTTVLAFFLVDLFGVSFGISSSDVSAIVSFAFL